MYMTQSLNDFFGFKFYDIAIIKYGFIIKNYIIKTT